MGSEMCIRDRNVKLPYASVKTYGEVGSRGYNFFLILLIDSNKEDFYICRQLLINNFVLKFFIVMRTNHLNLLLVLVLVLFPMSTRAYGADECVMLYTPYTKIAVPPGESINYSVDVINNCGEVKNASISVLGMPRGWKYEMKAGGWTVDQISVLPGEKKNFSFKVDVPFLSLIHISEPTRP